MNYFSQLEQLFLQVCSDTHWDFNSDEPIEIKLNTIKDSAREYFETHVSDLYITEINSISNTSFLKVESDQYVNYDPEIRLPFLKKSFIAKITEPLPNGLEFSQREADYWRKLLADQGQMIRDNWEESFHRAIFLTILDVYKEYRHLLLSLIDSQLQAPIPLSKPPSNNITTNASNPTEKVIENLRNTKFYEIFQQETYFEKVVHKLLELGWINENLQWPKEHENYIAPLKDYLIKHGHLCINVKTQVAAAFKNSFSVSGSIVTFRHSNFDSDEFLQVEKYFNPLQKK